MANHDGHGRENIVEVEHAPVFLERMELANHRRLVGIADDLGQGTLKSSPKEGKGQKEQKPHVGDQAS